MKAKDVKIGALVDPQTTVREQATAMLRAKHVLLAAEARRKVAAQKSRRPSSQRERRVVSTGEQAYERPWADPMELHPNAQADAGFSLSVSEAQYRALRRRRGRKARGAYWAVLGPAPYCLPGDLTSAAIFHRRIIVALERGGWTHNEQTALADLEKKWGKRARGEDARFVVAGNRPGRLDRTIERRIKTLKEQQS